ncbi:2-oxoacid:acceptor oxidoreductase family protein [bacterium]|nr:2-oxoacid:acceptor oxidoreductase family protein [bacterium]
MSHQDKREKKNRKKKTPIEEHLGRYDIRISGAGGQGIISTGMLLGEAISIGDGKNVSQSQSYGPEARGGATRADIIVSDGDIYFPECQEIDLLVAFTPEAYEKYSTAMKPDGIIVADKNAVNIMVGQAKVVTVPFIEIATKKFKRPIVANIIALGFISTFLGIVSQKSIKDAVEDRFASSSHLELNMKAIEEGFKLGREYKKKFS